MAEADISVNVEERMDVKARVLRHATDWGTGKKRGMRGAGCGEVNG